jgi:hypothetical protein
VRCGRGNTALYYLYISSSYNYAIVWSVNTIRELGTVSLRISTFWLHARYYTQRRERNSRVVIAHEPGCRCTQRKFDDISGKICYLIEDTWYLYCSSNRQLLCKRCCNSCSLRCLPSLVAECVYTSNRAINILLSLLI